MRQDMTRQDQMKWRRDERDDYEAENKLATSERYGAHKT
jgi:hypothetical protein